MKKARSCGGYAYDSFHGLVMSGGLDSDGNLIADVETTSDGVTFNKFQPLPIKVTVAIATFLKCIGLAIWAYATLQNLIPSFP